MDDTEKAPSRASRADRQGDMHQELRKQGYSSDQIEEMQRQLDHSGTPTADLEQLPKNLLIANALELEIPEPHQMSKPELVRAIRQAG